MSEVPEVQPHPELPELTNDAKNWAMICHLAGFFGFGLPVAGHVVGPLIIWMLKRDEHPFIDHQGKEAVNFQISMVIYGAILTPTMCFLVGIPLLVALVITDIVLMIIAAVSASRGEPYRYPLTIRLVK